MKITTKFNIGERVLLALLKNGSPSEIIETIESISITQTEHGLVTNYNGRSLIFKEEEVIGTIVIAQMNPPRSRRRRSPNKKTQLNGEDHTTPPTAISGTTDNH